MRIGRGAGHYEMMSIGERLRAERERQGLSISRVSEILRINARYLEAIERDDPDSLPGGFFYRSFVRQYARFLKIDDEEIERQLEALRPPSLVVAAQPETSEPFPLEVEALSSSAPHWEWLGQLPWSVIGLVAVLLGGAAIYSLWHHGRNGVEKPPPPAISAPPPVTAPATAQAPPQVAPPPSPVLSGEPAERPSAAPGPMPAEAGKPTATSPTPVAAPPPTPARDTRDAPPDAPGVRFPVALEATGEVWVSVTSAGRTLFVGTLQPGQSRQVEAAGSAKLVVGNAGGIEVRVNGKPVGPLGPKGQPRAVVLTPEGIVPPSPPTPRPPEQQP